MPLPQDWRCPHCKVWYPSSQTHCDCAKKDDLTMDYQDQLLVCQHRCERERPDREILRSKPYSSHRDDWYLRVVLAQTDRGEYVTWIYNYTIDGFTSGNYHGKNKTQALEDFWARGKWARGK